MDQTNLLSEITPRRLSALGPGGLTVNVLVLRFVTFIQRTMAEFAQLKRLKVQTLV